MKAFRTAGFWLYRHTIFPISKQGGNLQFTATLTIVSVFLAATITQCSNKTSLSVKDKTAGTDLYAKLCADCHGKNIADFEKITWKHGITESEIYNSIAAGYDNFGMPAFGKTLSKKDINLLTRSYIYALESKNDIILAEKNTTGVYESENMKIKLDTVATGMDKPWGMVQLANNKFLITDRDGTLYLVENNNKVKIKNVPEVRAEGQGGLLDIELHPKYDENGWIYISFSKPKTENDEEKSTTAIIRVRLAGEALTDIEEIFEAFPYETTRHHYGCRMVFDKQGYLFFGVGERGRHFEFPQKLDNDNGKIHRINDDGSIPADNPFYNTAGAKKSIYALGIRNPQGIACNEATGQIWENEHGPKGGDEINIIKPGVNYGWPVISYGINYDGSQLTGKRETAGMEQPVHYWVPSIAPAGMCFVNSNRYPGWKGNILVCSLKFKYAARCVIENNKIVKEEALLRNTGRMRFIKMGRDGYIYIGVESPGMVYRLMSISA